MITKPSDTLPQHEAAPPASPAGAHPSISPWAAWWTLSVLLLLMLYTIFDRPLISLMVGPLKQDLGLSDLQVGLVQGLSVALFTAAAGYPIAWLADRYDRILVLAAAISVWSVCLALAGLARSFEELFIASALVGAGEAGLGPIALTLIAEMFKGPQRHLANSAMLVGARLGTGLVIALCGWLLVSVDAWRGMLPVALQDLSAWRLALLAAGVPGLLLVPLILLLPVPRHARRAAPPPAVPLGTENPTASPAAAAAAARPGLRVLAFLSDNRLAFASFYLGVGALVFSIGCIMGFAPAVAMRQMGATPLQAGNSMGAATFTATIVGFLIAQGSYRWLHPKLGPRFGVMALIAGSVLSSLMAASMVLASTPTQLFIGLGCFLTAVMAGSLLFPTVLQEMTPAPIRTRLISIAFTFNIVVGALGPVAVGAVSDQLRGRPDGLLLAMAGSACLAALLSAVLLLPVVRRYDQTLAAARAAEGVSMS
ncbi:MAG: MFS transporter [Betaproteobacteria bacterium]